MIPEQINIVVDERVNDNAVMKVIGVGGGGCNAVNYMIKTGIAGVDVIAVNTDLIALNSNAAPLKIQIGKQLTKGLGAGANPDIGRKSAEENRAEIEEALKGADMVVVTAGMGGGTGTGAAPVVAAIAKSLGALVIGIVTKPFTWEGPARMKNAENGIAELRQHVDSLIVIPNQRIASLSDKKIVLKEAFNKPNEILYLATKGITSIVNEEGYINVDFADVKRVMYQSGNALIGVGTASGENKAARAAQMAISCPLLEGVNIKGAKNVLLNITVNEDFGFDELEEGNNVIREAAGDNVDVIFGVTFNPNLNDEVIYTVIATGFDKKETTSKSTVTVITPKPRIPETVNQDLFENQTNTTEIRKPVQEPNKSSTFVPINLGNSDINDNIERPAIERLKQSSNTMGFQQNENYNNVQTIKLETNLTGHSKAADSEFLRTILD